MGLTTVQRDCAACDTNTMVGTYKDGNKINTDTNTKVQCYEKCLKWREEFLCDLLLHCFSLGSLVTGQWIARKAWQ